MWGMCPPALPAIWGAPGEGTQDTPSAGAGGRSLQTFVRQPLPPTECPQAGPVQSPKRRSPLLHAQWLTFLERSLRAGLCAKVSPVST